MKLDLLINRENFSEVFNTSFSKYMLEEYRWSGEIIWKKNMLKIPPKVFLVNNKLNIIYPNITNKNKICTISKKNSKNPNFFKRVLQNFYVKLSFSFESFTNHSLIYFEPWHNSLSNLCIIPGNHSIRIIDFELKQCRVILKDGFNKSFISNEIKLRQKYFFLPTPKLIKVNEANNWFIEEQINALPLNRLGDKSLVQSSINKSRLSMIELYESESESTSISLWMKNILNSLDQAINDLPIIYTNSDKKEFNIVIKKIKEIILRADPKEIKIVQSHGDFQPANIMVDKSKDNQMYIIDWEYTSKRSIFYDALVFSTDARSPLNLSERIYNLIVSKDKTSWQWCFNTPYQKVELLNWMIGVFLLEDFQVRLQQLMIPSMKIKDYGLELWLLEFNKMTWLINSEN